MRKIANYTVEDAPIAKGGMGQIFRGRDEYGHTVAVKEILPEFANDWSIVSRIEKEVEFLMKIEHPSIVKLYAAFKDKTTDCYYIIMEHVNGMNIEQYVTRNGAIEPERATQMMIKILDAMQSVHNAHIVHRDIKPSNIMVRDTGEICLLDFGVAKDLESKAGMTVFGSVIGTTGYMSPEQANGYAIDTRSDIYSLGCVFYYMLTGHHAFSTLSSEFETKDAIINNDFPKLSKYKKGMPELLQKVLDRATQKNMTQRYSSCIEFASALSNGTYISRADNAPQSVKISLGREMCDIIINDPERKISRHHADIELKEFTGGQYYVFTDCSSNGTMIGNRLVNKQSESIPANGPYPEIYLANVLEGHVDWERVKEEIDKRRKSIIDETTDTDAAENRAEDAQPAKENDVFNSLGEIEDSGESARMLLIAASVFGLAGGLLGIALGITVATRRDRMYDGSKIYRYKKSHRTAGWIIAALSALLIIIYLGIRN